MHHAGRRVPGGDVVGGDPAAGDANVGFDAEWERYEGTGRLAIMDNVGVEGVGSD